MQEANNAHEMHQQRTFKVMVLCVDQVVLEALSNFFRLHVPALELLEALLQLQLGPHIRAVRLAVA